MRISDWSSDVCSSDLQAVIFETGTARGFSALCMARALQDAGAGGYVVTVDQLPHDRPMLWNCIDDHEGPRTRAQLLSDYPKLLSRIVFLRGRSDEVLKTLGLSRIHFRSDNRRLGKGGVRTVNTRW